MSLTNFLNDFAEFDRFLMKDLSPISPWSEGVHRLIPVPKLAMGIRIERFLRLGDTHARVPRFDIHHEYSQGLFRPAWPAEGGCEDRCAQRRTGRVRTPERPGQPRSAAKKDIRSASGDTASLGGRSRCPKQSRIRLCAFTSKAEPLNIFIAEWG